MQFQVFELHLKSYIYFLMYLHFCTDLFNFVQQFMYSALCTPFHPLYMYKITRILAVSNLWLYPLMYQCW